ncbi:hypothetical protein AB0C13_25380 [Streptomyces sp. NPDC049099]|uniref:hypothetical protein n=1 Tax=Streptomyces sp. NPDC049099 TaxID=3155768 RepID=UPI0034287933
MRETKQGPVGTPSPATQPRTGRTTAASVAASTDNAAALRAKWQGENARRTQAYLAIREHLQEQPTPQAVRTVARLWCRDITHLADDVVEAMNSTETSE